MKKGMLKNFWMDFVPACAFVSISLFAAACSDSNDVAGGASGDAGVYAVKDLDVAGVSQKGPFVTGSAVTVQELDGITLKQTGKSFKGTIKSDKGDFAIKDINLQSQYAILEANGYYRDEISGKKSSGTVTLRALTDLSNRKTVNINLLTHLEYERVKYLVTEKKKSIAEAKSQAEKEILASFAIEGEFAESEDLNIFKSGDGNAALLAVSVLMQGDVDVAGLTERMGEFSIAIAEGGSWDDADTKTAIADWACDTDLKGTLANVRKNIENWKYADTIPAFEKYVTNFWWNNYGLGVCNAKRENETKRNINKLSKLYNEYFVCEKGRWVIPVEEKSSSSKTTKSSSSSSKENKQSSSIQDVSSSSTPIKDLSSSSVSSSSSIYNPFISSSSSSVEQKKDTLPDLPDELAFVEDFLEKKTEYTEYADGGQIMWRGQTRALGGACDSIATELINEAAGKGFEYEGVYSNDSLDNDYTEDSYVYVRTSGGKVYTLVITKGEVRVWTPMGITMPSAMFYVKLIVREEGADEIPTETKKDYDSPKYREIPEDLKFVLDSTQYHYRYYSNDQKWTSWNCYTQLGSRVGASNDDYFDEAKAKADEYALMMEAHGFTLKSQETLTIDDLESMQYTEYAKSDYDGELTFYRFEKEVEKFRYEAEVFAVVDYYRNIGAEGYLFRARINITIYDK